jgi:hypothetical protein
MTSSLPASTLTSDKRDEADLVDRDHPYLFRVLQYDRPTAAASRHALGDLHEVTFGRAATDDATRSTSAGLRCLALGACDGHLSSRHARLVREVDQWVLEDCRSKNGSFVNGWQVERQLLHDGDIVELGHTLWRYRRLAAAPGPRDFIPTETVPGFATLLPAYGLALETLATVVRSNLAIIIEGDTGTGKEVLAHAIHARSGRPGPWVALNCSALPETLVASELFGSKRGAFSGASDDRVGIVRASDRGTLFLDEIADASASLQTALLRVTQEREVLPIGATQPVAVDLRLVAATQRDLGTESECGRFRRDLYARLAGFRIRLDPLRERIEDLGIVIPALLSRVAAGRDVRFSRNAAYAFLRYGWPLNVRELEQCLASAVLQASDDTVQLAHLPPPVRGENPGEAPPRGASATTPSRERLVELLREHRGNVSAIARSLGKARVQVQRWLKRHGLVAADYHG